MQEGNNNDSQEQKMDELYLLSEKADKRAERVIESIKASQKAHENKLDALLDKIQGTTQILDTVEQSAVKVGEHFAYCQLRAKKSLWVFLSTLLLSIIIITANGLYTKHVYDSLAEARLEIKQAKIILGNKPLFLTSSGSLSHQQGDYIRVVPNTETTMQHSNGESYPGVYAQVWRQGK